MKKIYKRLLVGTTIVILLFFFIILGASIGAGHYGYSQLYKCDVGENVLVRTIQTLKKKDSALNVSNSVGFSDSFDANHDYHAYIQYQNKIIHFHVTEEPGDTDECRIYLDAINEGLILGKWRVINRDYDRQENIYEKKQFEKLLLEKLNTKYTDRIRRLDITNNFSIFNL
jgi:hypothetical protein